MRFVQTLAWSAVVTYPLGLIGLNAVLLFLARDAIRSGKSHRPPGPPSALLSPGDLIDALPLPRCGAVDVSRQAHAPERCHSIPDLRVRGLGLLVSADAFVHAPSLTRRTPRQMRKARDAEGATSGVKAREA